MLDFSTNFELLNLSKTELAVYLDLAETGRGTAYQVSMRTGIKRTTVYSALSSLIQKSLITSEKKKTTTFYFANKPENIFLDLEKEKLLLNRKTQIAKDFVKHLSPIFDNRSLNIPKMQFVEGKENVTQFLYDHTDTWIDSVIKYDNTWWGYQDSSFVDCYQEWLKDAWDRKPKSQQIKLLSNSTPTEKTLKGKVKGREIRTISDKFNFTSTIWINGDHIVMIACRDLPHYAFQIKDRTFCANLRMIFQLLWESAGKV
jgi:sugar-specific transcriptional regulator TrmB